MTANARIPRALMLAMVLGLALLVLAAPRASAETVTSSNPTPIVIPDSGPATPYPSVTVVTGARGSVQDVNVTLRNMTHTYWQDLLIRVEAPDGTSVCLVDNFGGGAEATNDTITFDDEAGRPFSVPTETGSYRPECGSLSDFDGIDPNGQWRLFVYDDARLDSGVIAGGWTLTLEVDDRDRDGVLDANDNCVDDPNPQQENNDGDSQGDACDADDDNDTVADVADNCERVANPQQENNDGDSQGDACDADDDNDTVEDSTDNCQFTANTEQENNDGDSQGDVCDADDDNDSVADVADNCDRVANTDQENNDGDAQGDVCDRDDDNDGLEDGSDNCQFAPNPGQRDSDEDGRGDACDDQFDSTVGKATGGGFIVAGGGKVHLSVSAKSDGGRLTGTCVVTAGKLKIKCLDVDGYFQSPTSDRVVIVGDAEQDGVATRYRIELEDRGEPGRNDRFTVETDAGFAATGVLSGGNLQVHRK